MPDFNTKLLENFLSYTSVKSQTLSENLANIGTENYKRKDVKFSEVLNEEMNGFFKKTNNRHINLSGNTQEQKAKFDIVEDDTAENFSGINNVDIDREMSELAENTLRFKFASKKTAKYFKNLQNVIRGGGA